MDHYQAGGGYEGYIEKGKKDWREKNE